MVVHPHHAVAPTISPLAVVGVIVPVERVDPEVWSPTSRYIHVVSRGTRSGNVEHNQKIQTSTHDRCTSVSSSASSCKSCPAHKRS